jgi:hypothetical protein
LRALMRIIDPRVTARDDAAYLLTDD